MRPLKTLLACGLILCAGSLSATQAPAQSSGQEPARVAVVNHALQYIAAQLLGDAAEVEFRVPEEVDPSFWRPSISDISAIQSADLILLNGAGFATWVDRVSLPRSKLVNTTAGLEDQFIVTQSITHSHGEGTEHSHEGLASHTWLDPALAMAQAEAAAAAIKARGLAPADTVDAGLAQLRAEFAALEVQAEAALAPLAGVPMIATHPRYQYFARRFGVTVEAVEWEAGAAPTQAEMADLEALVTATDARVLIWEAAPPAAAFAMTSRLGLQNVVFPTLAHGVKGRSMTEVMSQAIAALGAVKAD